MLIVIGGVAAGLSAAARARRLDANLEIVVLEKGPVISYGACGLPYLVEGRVAAASELIVYTPEYFRKERRIEVRTNARVAGIAHPRREVVLDSGERLRYERLVIATGARCETRGIAGFGAPHTFTLHTLEDAGRMRDFLRDRRPKTAAVIGAGYIGVEAADALRRRGLAVTVFEATDHALLRGDAAFTEAVRRQLERHRVELRTGERVSSVDSLGYDMVVAAAGFKPNTELAAEAGIELGRTAAIRTDDRMETSVRGIFAAGDCAEVQHVVTNRPAWIPLGTTANKTGRVAGANAAGGRERFPGVCGTSIVSIFGMGFAAAGFSAGQARAEGFNPVVVRVEGNTRPRYYAPSKTTVELVADRESRRLVGGAVIGEDGAAGRINVIAAALQARMRVEEFEQLDLAYSPPFAPVWDPLLIAAQQLVKEF
ncbi:MAG: FAD-dependent oxidoreductase [Acidobacteriota bacterium]|nr:FAD-dependent oxidoreductase [Acidobacteriota bacterium]